MPDGAIAMGPSTLPYCDIVQLREWKIDLIDDPVRDLGCDSIEESFLEPVVDENFRRAEALEVFWRVFVAEEFG